MIHHRITGAIFIFRRRKEQRHASVTQNELDAEWEVKSRAALHPDHRVRHLVCTGSDGF